ncbi:MAG: SdpI family protein [Bacillota bacterium]
MIQKSNHKGYALNRETLKQDRPLWLFLAALIIAGFILYPMLPEQVPSHWNWKGEVDDYASRAFGAFGMPLLALGLYIMMLVLPFIDPKRENYARFGAVYRLLRWGIVLFMTGLYAVTVLAALGHSVNVGMLVKGGVAVLFILIGNVMGQIQHNYFVGIKTPWTLANEEVWRLTHRLGAKIWVLGGLVCLAMAPFQTIWSAYVFIAVITVMALVPVIHSYLVFRRSA